jgi:hypothetical protein
MGLAGFGGGMGTPATHLKTIRAGNELFPPFDSAACGV